MQTSAPHPLRACAPCMELRMDPTGSWDSRRSAHATTSLGLGSECAWRTRDTCGQDGKAIHELTIGCAGQSSPTTGVYGEIGGHSATIPTMILKLIHETGARGWHARGWRTKIWCASTLAEIVTTEISLATMVRADLRCRTCSDRERPYKICWMPATHQRPPRARSPLVSGSETSPRSTSPRRSSTRETRHFLDLKEAT